MRLDRSRYQPVGLEAIETASRDEIGPLQRSAIRFSIGFPTRNLISYNNNA
jgi:hypothetical protein